MKTSLNKNKSQSGMATLLMVVVIGMLLTVTTISVVYSGRSAQDKQVSVHAVTHSQSGVWAGAEIFRQYIEDLSEDDRNRILITNKVIQIKDASDKAIYTVSIIDSYAQLTDTDTSTDTSTSVSSSMYPESKFVEAMISYVDEHAKATSQIHTVIEVTKTIPKIKVGVTGIDVYGDIKIEGTIDFDIVGDTSVLNVDGNVTIDSVTISSLDEVNATKSIRIGSSVSLNSLWSNEDIVLNASSESKEVKALGNLGLYGSSKVDDGFVNGFIYSDSSGNSTVLSALALDKNFNQIGSNVASFCKTNADTCPSTDIVTNQFNLESYAALFNKSGSDIGTFTANGNVVFNNEVEITSLSAGQIEELCYDITMTIITCSDPNVVTRVDGNKYGKVITAGSNGKLQVINSLLAYAEVDVKGHSFGEIISYSDVTVTSELGISGDIYAEGFIEQNGTQTFGSLTAKDYIDYNGSVNNVTSDRKITMNGSASDVLGGGRVIINTNGHASTISSVGNVIINDTVNISQIETESSIFCNKSNWGNNTVLRFKTSKVGCHTGQIGSGQDTTISVDVTVPDITKTINKLAPLQPLELIDKPYVDMWLLEDSANFSFRNTTNGIEVRVRNMKMNDVEIIDETFYLFTQAGLKDGSYHSTHYNFLCKPSHYTHSTNTCDASDNYEKRQICVTSDSNGCFHTDTSGSTVSWTITDATIFIPLSAVYWFEGDLFVKSSQMNATLLATENITTDRDVTLTSISASSFSEVCVQNHSDGSKLEYYNDTYPLEYCDSNNNIIIPSSVGNVALGAGGKQDVSGTEIYKGGDIFVDAQSVINGTVLVGNEIFTDGTVQINGFFIALGWNDDPTHVDQSNLLKGNLKVIYDPGALPPTYDRFIPSANTICAESDLKNTKACKLSQTDDEGVEPVYTSQALWVRYL